MQLPLPQSSRAQSRAKPTQESSHHGLIQYIQGNPVRFTTTARAPSELLNDLDINNARQFFSGDNPTSYVHEVSTSFLRKRCVQLDRRLGEAGLSQFTRNRFWPFWDASDLRDSEANSERWITDYLLDLWNETDTSRFHPSLFVATGFSEVIKTCRLDNVFFIQLSLPIYKSLGTKPDSITIAFDCKTKAFFTMNSRLRCAEPEPRFKHVEFIPPEAKPPDLRGLRNPAHSKPIRALLILDRHIGENLSLYSTHIRHLAALPQVDLTLETSLCPFFSQASAQIMERFSPPGKRISLARIAPETYNSFDLVFDPYDWIPHSFHLKPQNDSQATSIASSIELADCQRQNKRRGILDIHLSALKNMGIIPWTDERSEFVQYAISDQDRTLARRQAREKHLTRFPNEPDAKLIVLFPFGLTSDRRYHSTWLQVLITRLLSDHRVRIVLAGTREDTPEMIQTVRSDWFQCKHHRVQVRIQEPLDTVIELMLASDVVVSIDSGPLHLARALRIMPIALYTGKVNTPEMMRLFPWFVIDGTAQTLLPVGKNEHVEPNVIFEAVRRRLH